MEVVISKLLLFYEKDDIIVIPNWFYVSTRFGVLFSNINAEILVYSK